MEEYVWETAEEIIADVSKRIRNVRRRRKISQEQLSLMSGVSYGSIKRFESTGQISFLSLTKIAMALGCRDEIKELFCDVVYLDIEEVMNDGK